ncbi:APC family permease [Klugiella xanthotipulae]|uniref:Amino acid/polyamine/organocation transporter (APC superfamily) n=1 Tax=Klugiella xanthotipulae TaxID=244735 RepID=A0A543HZ11_9MICO|nr:APC family permease [Klugiella xanthotipulae]TQM63495.1 amino acid/polyamine/organocation transporter (APC superfamily) [Klugiella xanthotipulae]
MASQTAVEAEQAGPDIPSLADHSGGEGSRRRLGVPAITFLIIAASAPLTVLAGGVTTTFSVTHILGVPVSFALLALSLGIFAVGYTTMSRFVRNAGAFYAYIAQGLGRPLGVGASLVALVAYNAMQIGIYGMFGFQVSNLISEKVGVDIPWWIPVLASIAVVGLMGVNRVDLSAKVLAVLVALEFIAVIVFDVAAFGAPAEGVVSVQALNPAELFVPGIGAVFAFGIAAFMGFESAAIYSEEAKDPQRTVPRATFLAVIIIGVFYTISSWAMTLAVGPGRIVDPSGITAEEAGPPLFFTFVFERLGPVWVDLMSVLFITSIFAALVSFHNAVARYFFSLGREGVVPLHLARVRRVSRAPWAGSVAQTVIAIVVIIGFAIAGTGSEYGPAYPVVTLFSWLTNTGALGLVLLMVCISLAVIGFFWRDARGVGRWARMIAPTLSFVLLLVVCVLVVFNFNVLLGQAETTAATFIFPAIAVLPGAVGVVWGLRMRAKRPEIYRRIGHGAE